MSYGSKIGCSGWIRTSAVPFNKRTDYCYPTEQLKMVTAAGLAPAVTWSQARHVAATLRGVAPAHWERKPGAWFFVETRPGSSLGRPPRRRLALSMGLAPTLFPQTTGCFSIQLRELVGSVGNAPIRRFRFYLTTPDLQSGNRITSRRW